jgi:dTMP kinase
MKGRFITFEGIEGSGKSTQIELLAARLRTHGVAVLVTREPGGTPVAEAIRGVLLDVRNRALQPAAELLLYAAARAQLVGETIRPALEAGTTVLCDRFADSTAAYQGYGRGAPIEAIAQLHAIAAGGLEPDRTFVLDLPVAEGLARARARGRADRIEQEPVAFHERVRAGYLELARHHPQRVVLLNGLEKPEVLAARIWAAVADLFPAEKV